jgi:hypothetical protein
MVGTCLFCMSTHSWACLLVAPGGQEGEERTLFRKQANFRMQRISSLNEGEAGRQVNENLEAVCGFSLIPMYRNK